LQDVLNLRQGLAEGQKVLGFSERLRRKGRIRDWRLRGGRFGER
jgi:hypothetical protein